MFNFNDVEVPKRLNRDFVLSKVSDAMIFGYYFGKFNLKSIYPSKFHKDKNPSSGFYVSKSGKIIYNHLNGKEPKMDCFEFVKKLYNCEFRDAVKRIALDFGLTRTVGWALSYTALLGGLNRLLAGQMRARTVW